MFVAIRYAIFVSLYICLLTFPALFKCGCSFSDPIKYYSMKLSKNMK